MAEPGPRARPETPLLYYGISSSPLAEDSFHGSVSDGSEPLVGLPETLTANTLNLQLRKTRS